MNAEQLSRVGEKLVKRCGSRDPFEIARQLGINVMLCESFGSLKGMYRVIKRNRFIFLNNSLDENMLRIVCAHELGHDQLHRNMAKTTPIHEFMLYDMKSKPEYEANIVVAQGLSVYAVFAFICILWAYYQRSPFRFYTILHRFRLSVNMQMNRIRFCLHIPHNTNVFRCRLCSNHNTVPMIRLALK